MPVSPPRGSDCSHTGVCRRALRHNNFASSQYRRCCPAIPAQFGAEPPAFAPASPCAAGNGVPDIYRRLPPSPYTQEEGALDVARAVRFIRKNADMYGIDPDDIAVMGFSASGIQAGEFLMHYDENVNGTALDSAYVPDELDAVPAHASAAGIIYSFYGRLSVGNMDPNWLAARLRFRRRLGRGLCRVAGNDFRINIKRSNYYEHFIHQRQSQ